MQKSIVILLTGLFMFTFNSICWAAVNETEIVDSFKQTIDSKMNPVFESYNNENDFEIVHSKEKYYKETIHVNNSYRMDIQKTTSLVSPYIGYAEIDKIAIIGKSFNTMEQAMADKSNDELLKNSLQQNNIEMLLHPVIVNTVRLNYAYQNNQWILTGILTRINTLGIFSEWSDYKKPLDNLIDKLKYKTSGAVVEKI